MALVAEYSRQEENCGYTAVSFTIWLRTLRQIKTACQVVPIVAGALATWGIVHNGAPVFAAVCTLLATAIPPAYRATKADDAIRDYEVLAGEFTNLRDRFRQLALTAAETPDQLREQAAPFLVRLEKARQRMLTPPEWAFRQAKAKFDAGHYEHAVAARPLGRAP